MARPEDQANDLLAEQGVHRAPVPVERIAQRLGARLSYKPLFKDGDDVSGLLFRDGSKVVIGINGTHPPTRQRFTIAHELGHLLLHPGKPMILDRARIDRRDSLSSMATDKQEIEANQFAASLLMPVGFIRKDISRQTRQTESVLVARLAKKYEVSEQAMRYRLVNLGVFPSPSEVG